MALIIFQQLLRRPGDSAGILAILLTSCLCNCGLQDPGYRRAVREYSQRNPVAEANVDFQAGQFAIYSAMGFGLYFPGVEPGLGTAIMNRYSTIPLPGTSDAIESSAHMEYIDISTSFAAEYDKQMIALLRKSGRLSRPTNHPD